MCGRYLFSQDEDDEETVGWMEELRKEETSETLSAVSLGEVRPSNLTPVLILKEDLHPKIMRWGLPKWDDKGILINTRSETALSSPLFKQHVQQRRCIIKAEGFYEWDIHKNKFLIKSKNDKKLYMAGIYDDEPIPSFSILTRESEGEFAEIHNRIPLLIPEKYARKYLSDGAVLLDDLRKIPLEDLIIQVSTFQTSLF